jgi:hypothetical protein
MKKSKRMKIKVGDRVKFLNDTGSGEVTRIVDPKTALVQVDDGFEVPWMIADLVVDTGKYDIDHEEEEEEISTPGPSTTFSERTITTSEAVVLDDEEVVLAFLPDENSSAFETYLVNSSSYHFKYTISRQQEGELILFSEGTLEAGIKISLGNYQPGNINDEEYFRIQGIFFNAGFFNHIPPLDLLITVSAAEMYDAGSRIENDYFLEKAILHTLHDWRKPDPTPPMEIDAEQLKRAMVTKGDLQGEKRSVRSKELVEVDLHIEKLIDNHRSLEHAEILEIQMSRFRTALESAILHKDQRIVFIHGVGNGKLKHELRRTLDKEYKSCRYQDASFREYGYGATMVITR